MRMQSRLTCRSCNVLSLKYPVDLSTPQGA